MKTIKLLIIAMVSMTMASCGVIFSGTSTEISFDADVENVEVIYKGGVIGATPLQYDMNHSTDGQLVVFKKRGYKDKLVHVDAKFNKVTLFNLFNLFAWGVDFIFGGASYYPTDNYKVVMEPIGDAS